jgi:hypothetical protein
MNRRWTLPSKYSIVMCIAFQVIAERQPEFVMPVFAVVSHKHKTKRLNGDVLIHHRQVGKPEQLGTPLL